MHWIYRIRALWLLEGSQSFQWYYLSGRANRHQQWRSETTMVWRVRCRNRSRWATVRHNGGRRRGQYLLRTASTTNRTGRITSGGQGWSVSPSSSLRQYLRKAELAWQKTAPLQRYPFYLMLFCIYLDWQRTHAQPFWSDQAYISCLSWGSWRLFLGFFIPNRMPISDCSGADGWTLRRPRLGHLPPHWN